MKKSTILVVEDHAIVRKAWSLMLNSRSNFEVIAECGSGEEAIVLSRQLNPDIIVMDINLPGISGIEATQSILGSSPLARIIAISEHTNTEHVRTMLHAGAKAYVTKSSEPDEMFDAFREVLAGNKYICHEIKEKLAEEVLYKKQGTGVKRLTKRESEIVNHIRKGSSSKDISAILKVSQKTVEVHRYNILKKLRLKNSLSLVNYINENPTLLTHKN